MGRARPWCAPPIFLYRLLYGGVLSRLPSRSPCRSASGRLRLVPLDLLPVFRNDDPSPRVTLGGVRLPNPLILSSMYYDTTILRRAMGLGFGAVTAKSITPKPRPGIRSRTSCASPRRRGPGSSTATASTIPASRPIASRWLRLPHRVPLIVAAAGESAEDYVAVVEGLAPFGDLVEINISSPNTKLVYGWSERPRGAGGDLPRGAKGDGQADHRQGVAGFPATPTRRRRFPRRATRASPSSTAATRAAWTSRASRRRPADSPGPRCSARTLENVRRLRERFGDSIEIIATGGIDTPDKALQALRAGATACALLHGIHHARAVPGAENPRRPCQGQTVTHSLSTYPQTSTPRKNARSDAVPRARIEYMTLQPSTASTG